MSLKFYADEAARWPQLHLSPGHRYVDSAGKTHVRRNMDEAEVELGIRRLSRKFGLSLKHVGIEFTRGNRHSHAGRNVIRINMDFAGWLLIAHEVAHVYYRRKLAFETRDGRVEHGRRMAGIVDRFAAWIIQQRWHEGELAHEVALDEMAREARREHKERLAATPPPIEARIEHQAEQVTRLERKVKTLTTRLKTARRSLAALERQANKRGSAGF